MKYTVTEDWLQAHRTRSVVVGKRTSRVDLSVWKPYVLERFVIAAQDHYVCILELPGYMQYHGCMPRFKRTNHRGCINYAGLWPLLSIGKNRLVTTNKAYKLAHTNNGAAVSTFA